MSAYIVDRGHIRFLVAAAWELEAARHSGRMSYYHGNPSKRYEVNEQTLDETGLMLWQECLTSVAYRYPNEPEAELPGPVDDGPRFGYTHPLTLPRQINPVDVLSAIRCYEYQSCEHPGWEESRAKAFCDALTSLAIACLPGYDKAPWGAPTGWETEKPTRPRLVVSR